MRDPESVLEAAFSDVRPNDAVGRSILASIRTTPQIRRGRRVRAFTAAGAGLALAAALLLAFVFPHWLGTYAPAGLAPGSTAPPVSTPRAGQGYVGFTAMPVVLLTPKQRELWSVKAQRGVVAVRVFKGSPAEKAGLRNGDVLLQFAGKDVPSTNDVDPGKPAGAKAFGDAFAQISSIVRPGADVALVVARGGKAAILTAVAVDLEAMKMIVAGSGEEDEGDEGDDEGGQRKEAPDGPDRPPGRPPR